MSACTDIYAPAFAARVQDRRRAKKAAAVLVEAQERAQARIDAAVADAQAILEEARAEAQAIIARLPDFDAIEAAPARRDKGALHAIREVADRYGMAMAVVVGKSRPAPGLRSKAYVARQEAVRAVAKAAPRLSDRQIAELFAGMDGRAVRAILAAGGGGP